MNTDKLLSYLDSDKTVAWLLIYLDSDETVAWLRRVAHIDNDVSKKLEANGIDGEFLKRHIALGDLIKLLKKLQIDTETASKIHSAVESTTKIDLSMNSADTIAWLKSQIPTLPDQVITSLSNEKVDGTFLRKHRAFGDLIELLREIGVGMGWASKIDAVVANRIKTDK